MFAMKKLILPDQKAIKEQQVLQLKKERASASFCKMVGLTLLGIFTQKQ